MKNNIELVKSKILATVKKLIKYNDIGFVFNRLEDLVITPIPFRKGNENTEEYENNKQYAVESISIAERTLDELSDELSKRTSTFEAIRETNPDFCLNMQSKISEDEYLDYKFLLKECINSLSSLIISGNHKNHRRFTSIRKFKIR